VVSEWQSEESVGFLGRSSARELSVHQTSDTTYSLLFRRVATRLLRQKRASADNRISRLLGEKKINNQKKRKAKKRLVSGLSANPSIEKSHQTAAMSSAMDAEIAAANGGGAKSEFKEDLSNILMCPDCREMPPNLVEEFSNGDMVCDSCGLVVGERIIDTRSEWRTFSNDDQGNDDPSRVGDGPNLLLEGSQLETSIAFDGGKGSKNLSHIQNKMSKDKTSANLLEAYKKIGAYTDRIQVGKVVADSAKHIYKLVDDAKFLKGKSPEAIIAGCIFIACRHNKVPRTFREIYALTHVTKKEIGRVFKQLEAFLSKLDPSVMQSQAADAYTGTGSTSADELCARYCSQLWFRNSHRIEKVSKLLASKTSTVPDLAGRSPLSVAAACIYFASYLLMEKRSSKQIAGIAGVSDGTIRTAYRFLYNARDQLVDPAWIANGQGSMDLLPPP
jgi:transcription initiation factor TFIIB